MAPRRAGTCARKSPVSRVPLSYRRDCDSVFRELSEWEGSLGPSGHGRITDIQSTSTSDVAYPRYRNRTVGRSTCLVSLSHARAPALTARVMGITVLLMATLTFKVTDREARLIRSRARRERVTVSEYLRRRASLALAPARKVAKMRCRYTGAMIFASPDNQPPLTTDAVRDLLSDFP